MSPIIYLGGSLQILQPWARSSGGADGFDSASLRVDYPGTGEAFTAAYPVGAKSTGGGANMYFSGVQIERTAPGYTTGTVFSRGFWDNKTSDMTGVMASQYAEKLWPYTEAGIRWYLPGAAGNAATIFNPDNVVNGVAQPWRIREVLSEYTIERIGVEIITGSALAWPGPPKPTGTLTEPNPTNSKDPLLSTKRGWVQQGLNPSVVAKLGPITLLSWQDSWRYIFPKE